MTDGSRQAKTSSKRVAAASKSEAGHSRKKKSRSDIKKTKSIALRIAGTLGCVFVCAMILGYYLGRTRSVDFEDATRAPSFIQKYVADHVTTRTTDQFSGIYGQHKHLVGISASNELSFVCADREFVYDLDLNKLAIQPHVQALEGVGPPRTHLDFIGTLSAFTGGIAAYHLTKVGPQATEMYEAIGSPESKRNYILATAGAAASGLAIGFWFGYSNEPRCGAKLFQKLLNDNVFWAGVAERMATAHSRAVWSFHWDKMSVLAEIRNDREAASGARGLSACFPNVVSVFDHSCDTFLDPISKVGEEAPSKFGKSFWARHSSFNFANCQLQSLYQGFEADAQVECTWTAAPVELSAALKSIGEKKVLAAINHQTGCISFKVPFDTSREQPLTMPLAQKPVEKCYQFDFMN